MKAQAASTIAFALALAQVATSAPLKGIYHPLRPKAPPNSSSPATNHHQVDEASSDAPDNNPGPGHVWVRETADASPQDGGPGHVWVREATESAPQDGGPGHVW
jgi:hypothetical protein